MFANAVEFSRNPGGQIFLIKAPLEGLCLIGRNGRGDLLTYYDPRGKVVGKKYLLPLEISNPKFVQLIKDIRKNSFSVPVKSSRDVLNVMTPVPIKVNLSIDIKPNHYSYKQASISLSYNVPLRHLYKGSSIEELIIKMKKKYKKQKVYKMNIHLDNPQNEKPTIPELGYLNSSGNEKILHLQEFPESNFEAVRFLELKSPYNGSRYEILSTKNGNNLIFLNRNAVLMIRCPSGFSGTTYSNSFDSLQTYLPLYKLFDIRDKERDIWKETILMKEFTKYQNHELEECNEFDEIKESNHLIGYKYPASIDLLFRSLPPELEDVSCGFCGFKNQFFCEFCDEDDWILNECFEEYTETLSDDRWAYQL